MMFLCFADILEAPEALLAGNKHTIDMTYLILLEYIIVELFVGRSRKILNLFIVARKEQITKQVIYIQRVIS